jgi:YidC/Oxa1 family membrane protein insertase
MFDFLLRLLGQLFYAIYNTVGFHNYGLTIIVITVIIKLALMPLSIKSIKSTQKMSELTPEIEKIKAKYKNDQQKQSAEIQKLYKDNNVSCLGGCLPMLLQFPILIAMYSVFRGVLTYVMGLSKETVIEIASRLGMAVEGAQGLNEIEIVNQLVNNQDKFNLVSDLISRDQLINFNFLGLNLGVTPSYNPAVIFGPEIGIYLPLLIIPILGVITVIISQKMTQPAVKPQENAKKADEQPNPTAGMTKMMKYMIPGMTLYFSFIFPAGLGLYWICTYLIQIAQQAITNKIIKKEKENKKLTDGGNK